MSAQSTFLQKCLLFDHVQIIQAVFISVVCWSVSIVKQHNVKHILYVCLGDCIWFLAFAVKNYKLHLLIGSLT